MGNKNFRMYEIGKVFHIKEKATEDSSGVEEKEETNRLYLWEV